MNDDISIIDDYIDKLYKKLNKHIKITIKSIGGKPIYITIPENSSIKQVRNIFISEYPIYKNKDFFLLSSGYILDEDEKIKKFKNEEAIYLIERTKKLN